MARRVLITRPRDDGEQLAAMLREHGIDTIVEPLLDIRILEGGPLVLDNVQALLLTSANGVRAFAARSSSRSLPVYAVGDATARTAREVGFSRVESASGDIESLTSLVIRRVDPKVGILLHVSGKTVAGDLGNTLTRFGFQYRREILYVADQSRELSDRARAALVAGTLDGVVVFSPRTGLALVRLLTVSDLAERAADLDAFCLSAAVARSLSELSWRKTVIADRPDQAAMVRAVVEGCG
jgi:uroporphyrinogen-III synthase